MTLKLRPHHLLCILTYAGRGYSRPFVNNFDAVVERILNGELIRIVNGPDDICSPLLDDGEAHCRKNSVIQRDLQAAKALSELLGRSLESGTSVHLDGVQIRRMRQSFVTGDNREACAGCEWHAFCTGIATHAFEQAQLQISD